MALWELISVDAQGNKNQTQVAHWKLLTDEVCLVTSWRSAYGLEERDESGAHVMSGGVRYLDAMYWSMTTMTTIGFPSFPILFS